jgi:hypothetical protein
MTTSPQVTGPGRASPVPVATFDTFRAPYAGESLGTCISRSSVPSVAFALMEGARHSLIPARRAGYINDAAGFASCYGPHRRSPVQGF